MCMCVYVTVNEVTKKKKKKIIRIMMVDVVSSLAYMIGVLLGITVTVSLVPSSAYCISKILRLRRDGNDSEELAQEGPSSPRSSLSSGSGRGTLAETGATSTAVAALQEEDIVLRFGRLISGTPSVSHAMIYEGHYCGNLCCIKQFSPSARYKFLKELEVFDMIKSVENLATLLYSDPEYDGCGILVIEYYPGGDLEQFLRQRNGRTIDFVNSMRIIKSMLNGLMYLHSQLETPTWTKKRIAHMDISPKNIFLKDTMICNCVLADFDHSIIEGGELPTIPVLNTAATPLRIGTRRYMAPEMLEGTVEYNKFDLLLKIDIYSICLVIWEVLINSNGLSMDGMRSPVYCNHVDPNPTVQAIRSVVVDSRTRPTIPPHWRIYCSQGVDILSQGWHHDPNPRVDVTILLNLADILETNFVRFL